jgi:hypothetical protein
MTFCTRPAQSPLATHSRGMTMARVMPSQLVQTIDELFPRAVKNSPGAPLMVPHSPKLLGILNLLKSVPDELMTMPPAEYADLVLAQSTIEETPWSIGEPEEMSGRWIA